MPTATQYTGLLGILLNSKLRDEAVSGAAQANREQLLSTLDLLESRGLIPPGTSQRTVGQGQEQGQATPQPTTAPSAQGQLPPSTMNQPSPPSGASPQPSPLPQPEQQPQQAQPLPARIPMNVTTNISKEGDASFSFSPQQSVLDDQRRGVYVQTVDQLSSGYQQTGMPEGMARTRAYREAASVLGYLPEGFANLLQMSNDEKDASFNALYQRTVNDPSIYKTLSVQGFSGERLDKMVQIVAARAVSQDMGGYVPDWAKPFVLPQAANLSTQVEDALATRGLTKFTATGEDVNNAIMQVQDLDVQKSGRESFTDTMSKAWADAEKPVSGEDQVKWGVPAGTHYADIPASRNIVLSSTDKSAFENLQAAKLTVRRLQSYLSIFPKESDPVKRAKAWSQLMYEATTRPANPGPDRLDPVTKEPLWRIYLRFKSTRENSSILFRQLAGENSSRFSDKDQQVAMKQMPPIGITPGNLIDDQTTAASRLTEVIKLLDERMATILASPVQPMSPSAAGMGVSTPTLSPAQTPQRLPGESADNFLRRVK